MHIGNPGNAAQLLQALQAQGGQKLSHEDSNAFNKALQMQQQVTKPTTPPGQGNSATQLPGADGQLPGNGTGNGLHGDGSGKPGLGNGNGSGSGSGTNSSSGNSLGQNTLQGAAGAKGAASAPSMFNAQGNLAPGTNMQDFKLLNNQNVLMQQVMTMSRNISATQAAALQPSVMISVGMLSRLYQLLELNKRRQASLAANAGPTNNAAHIADDAAMQQQNQVLSLVFIERLFKLFDPEKHLALSRFFKKGPLGEHEHDDNTDDEYGNTYADTDNETDYIKRPRRDRPGMAFHHSMLT